MTTKTSPSASSSTTANTRSGLPPVPPSLHSTGPPSSGASILQVSTTFDNLTVSDVKKSTSSESIDSAQSSTSANGTVADAGNGIEKESSSSSLASSASGGARKKKGRPPRFSLQTLSVQYDTSCILDHVYLGAKNVTDDAETLEKLGITCIINCTEETSKRDDEDHGIKYLQVKIGDTPAENISKYFEVTGQLINETKKSQGKVSCSIYHIYSSSKAVMICIIFHTMIFTFMGCILYYSELISCKYINMK